MSTPTLVFLHGFLGSAQDWQPVLAHLTSYPCILLDLPSHGKWQHLHCDDFEQCCQFLRRQIQRQLADRPYILVGYSLGGRLALYYGLHFNQDKQLVGLIVEGANLGLEEPQEKALRWQNDQKWARRFAQEPLKNVLQDWYQQAVFTHLTQQQQQQLVQLRQQNQGESLSRMLLATSLAKQPNLYKAAQQAQLPIFYLYGEKDIKFKNIAHQSQLPQWEIPQAGHNAHKENPLAFAKTLTEIMQHYFLR